MNFPITLKKIPFLLIVLCLGVLFIFPRPASAVYFDEAIIRLDRQQSFSPLSGVACVRPSLPGAGVESDVDLTFPTDFSLDINSSSWTISDTNLPTGSQFWPSANSQPVSVSGQTLTISTADLTADVLYCFNFSSPTSQTGDTGKKTGQIATYSSTGTEINSRQYQVEIVASDGVSVTGRIAARPPDLINSLAILTSGSPYYYTQETVLEYRFTYGTSLDYSTDLTVQASWGLGTVQGESVPTVSLLDYVDGSAELAYGDSPAVVDTAARTITWNISDYPANSQDQLVFKLRTRSNHPGNLPVSFTVSGRVQNPETAALSSSVTKMFLFDNDRPWPTSAVTTSTSVSSTPTPSPAAVPAFSSISLWSVSAENGSLTVVVNQPARVSVSYGSKLDQLSDQIVSPQYSSRHSIRFDSLSPDTQYFFKLFGRTESGRSFISGIYTFRTASSSPQSAVYDPKSFFALSSGNLIFDPTFLTETVNLPFLVMPKSIDYEIKFTLADQTPIESARVIVQDTRVLGWPSTVKAAELSVGTGEVLQLASNTFTTRLTTPEVTGDYEIYVQITDVYGNQTTTKLADLFVTDYLTVSDASSGNPVENAQINFYLRDPINKTYRLISPQMFPLKNPDYTDREGLLQVALPPLDFRIEVNAIGYKTQTVDFSLRPGSHSFPSLKLDPEPFLLKTVVVYYATIVADALDLTRQYVEHVTGSMRFFQLSALLSICIFIFLNFLSLRTRTNIPLLSLFEHFWRHAGIKRAIKPHHEVISGQIMDGDTGKPLVKAGIFVLDDQGKVVSHIYSNPQGHFSLVKLFPGNFHLEVLKEGYASASFIPADPLVLKLTRVDCHIPLTARLKSVFWYLSSLLFEVFLLASLVSEIFFGLFFSWWQVLPFLFLSLVNLVLWAVYKIHLKSVV